MDPDSLQIRIAFQKLNALGVVVTGIGAQPRSSANQDVLGLSNEPGQVSGEVR